jgi:hypothetical protein
MWIMLNDAFFSIVSKDCARDELMVRARRPGDIEKLFPAAVVTEYTASDYHYRAAVKRTDIAEALVGELARVTYSNFKDSVTDRPLHDAYVSVWCAMARLQPKRPYSGKAVTALSRSLFDFEGADELDKRAPAQGKRKATKKATK